MAYPDHLDPVEQQIIDLVVRKALDTGHKIEVYGEGECDLEASDDYEAITSEIAACGMTELILTKLGVRTLWILFVHGNGCDVLVDYTAGDDHDAFLKEANDLADSLQ